MAEAKSGLEGLKLSVAIESQKIDSPCPDGTVAKTDPAGSTSAGSQVSLILSNGTPSAVIVDFDIGEGPASLAKGCSHLFGFRLCHSSHETIMECLFWYFNPSLTTLYR